MPPKKASKSSKSPPVKPAEKNAISNLFNKITSKDSLLKECKLCNQKIKSCLFNDHLNTKCPNRKIDSNNVINNTNNDDDNDEVIFMSSNFVSNTEIKVKIEKKEKLNEVKIETNNEEIKEEEEELIKSEQEPEQTSKRIKIIEDDDDKETDELLLKLDYEKLETNLNTSVNNTSQQELLTQSTQLKPEFDYNLNNFENAINSVINEETFKHLLNDSDLEIIKKFSYLSTQSRTLYVRLFQRKYKWLNLENINYEKISNDLMPQLNELLNESFLIDESTITSYEEIIYLLKLPQLKELAKICHVQQTTVKVRSEFIKLILQHFRTQKSLKFNNNKSNEIQTNTNKPYFMIQCKKILGKCFKLNQESRDVFVRLLMLFSLSSCHHFDPNKKDNPQQQNFLQILLVNIGKVKYMPYEINLTINIFENRDALLRYQESLEYLFDLVSLIDAKELEEAYEKFNEKIYEFEKIILNPDLNLIDSNLPIYLRNFTPGATYCKFISMYAFEVLQKLKLYKEANDLFEFLISKQNVYSLSTRGKWFERLALNYEAHLKNPFKAFETLCLGLNDKTYVRKAGRLALYNRLMKMSETKKYLKIKDFKASLNLACSREKYEYQQAPTYEIEGTTLQSDLIPGRKNIFIQNYEPNENDEENSIQSQSDILIKGAYNLSVENVALTHYIKNLEYTNGKHAETAVITTIYGLLFWNIIFDSNIENVFVDKFQSCPLDMQTDYFYLNRKDLIDSKVELLANSPIDFICDTLIRDVWNKYHGFESIVSWSLFEDLNECLSLIRCFNGVQLANLCKYISMQYRYCRSGGPDLIVWSEKTNKCKFVEVKGPGDHLSFKQMVWLDFFIQNSIDCEVCYVKAQQNSKRLRQ